MSQGVRRLHLLMPLLLLPLLLGGCVDRMLIIRSDPPGARVFVDGRDLGTTPTEVPFEHYGTREVMVRMEEIELRGERALAPQTRMVEVSAPWYQWFPFDLFSEFLYPGTIVDAREVMFTLEPHDADDLGERFREKARARGIRLPFDPAPDSTAPIEEGASPPADTPDRP